MLREFVYPPGWLLQAECGVEAYTLRLHEKADGPPGAPALCFIHGLGENWDIWLEAASHFPPDYRLVCLELPWNGRDGYRWGQVSSAAKWLQKALQLLSHPPVAFIAHSFGANAVLDYLHHHSLDTQALVLASPFYVVPGTSFDWPAFYATLENFKEVMKQGIKVKQNTTSRDNASLLKAMTDKVIERIGPLGFLEFFSLYTRTPALHLDQVSIPTLIVTGDSDSASPLAANAHLQATLPQGFIELIPQCGHFCMLEQPGTFAHLVNQFLAKQLCRPGQ